MLWHDGDMKIKAVGYTSTNNGCEVEIQIEKTPIWLHFLLQFLESWLI